jgi:hypothetical protein
MNPMGVLVRVLGVLIALLVLAVVALAILFPRIVASDAVRERIEEAGRDALGRDVTYTALDFGLLPPRLVVRGPRVADEQEVTLFEAEDIALQVALWPLLRRTLVVDSLRAQGATARLVRTEDGIEHPFRRLDAEAAPREAWREPREEAPRDAEEGFALALRQVGLRDSRVLLEDRVVSPPVTWDLHDLDVTARGDSLDAPIDFELRGTLASGGSLRVEGRGQRDGAVRADATLSAIRLEALGAYLAAGQSAAGAASGTVAVDAAAGRRPRVKADLKVRDGELAADDLTVRGPFAVRADFVPEEAGTEGTFEIDATDAAIDYGPSFRKPPGQAAVASGRLVPGAQGELVLEDTHVRIRNFEADVRLESGARTRAEIRAAPFALDGWEDLVPALAELAPRGRVGIPELTIATAPLELLGTIESQGVVVTGPDGQDMELAGRVLGTGGGVRSESLSATLAGQRVPLEIEVRDLAKEPRATLRTAADGLDTRALLRALGVEQQTLEGPLSLDARLAAPLGGEAVLRDVLEGTVRFEVVPGRLRGVSLLESTFERIGSVGEAALLAGRLRGGRSLQRFYDDAFESLSGTFSLAGGRARTDDLRLVYRHYTVDLRGVLGLADAALDLTGTLTIGEEIDAAIAAGGEDPAPDHRGRQRVIPLARVTGTAASPRVALTPEAALQFAALYATERRREKWEEKIDERIGEGAGREVLDTLDQILRGRQR